MRERREESQVGVGVRARCVNGEGGVRVQMLSGEEEMRVLGWEVIFVYDGGNFVFPHKFKMSPRSEFLHGPFGSLGS